MSTLSLDAGGADVGSRQARISCVERLCEAIVERTGIVPMEHQIEDLGKLISEACQRFGYASPESFIHAVRSGRDMSAFDFLIRRIAVGESYFFRDPLQMGLLKDKLLPDILGKRRAAGRRYLRVWSAGCSCGQEIYSVAIMLRDLLPDIEDWALYLLGTDINRHSLALASEAKYRRWSFRAAPLPIMENFFNQHNDEYRIREDIKLSVDFEYLNLIDEIYPSVYNNTHDMDIILCRNVLVYMSPNQAGQIVERLTQSLVTGGQLLLGPADHFHGADKKLERTEREGSFYFTRISA